MSLRRGLLPALFLCASLAAAAEPSLSGDPFRGRNLLSEKRCTQCHSVPRAELTALYLAEVAALKASGACDAYSDPDDCPAYRTLNERQAQRRSAWVECSP